MYVVGFASTARGPGAPPGSVPIRTSAVAACGRRDSTPPFDPNDACARRASSSSTICPTLCRFPAYCGPGFPSPTTSQRPSLIAAPLPPSSTCRNAGRPAPSRYRASRRGRRAARAPGGSLRGRGGLGLVGGAVLGGDRRDRDGDDDLLGVALEHGALRERQLAGGQRGAGLEALDGDLDVRGQVRGLGLEGQRLGLDDVDGARGRLAHDRDRDLDLDLLAAADDQQVDVLDDVLDRVALDVLGQGQDRLAVDLDLEQRVRGALDREHGLVAREGDVDRLGAVPVQDGRDLVGATQAAGGALAELGAGGGGELDLGHGDSWGAEKGDGERWWPRRGARDGHAEAFHPVDHGPADPGLSGDRPTSLAEATGRSYPGPRPARNQAPHPPAAAAAPRDAWRPAPPSRGSGPRAHVRRRAPRAQVRTGRRTGWSPSRRRTPRGSPGR